MFVAVRANKSPQGPCAYCTYSPASHTLLLAQLGPVTERVPHAERAYKGYLALKISRAYLYVGCHVSMDRGTSRLAWDGMWVAN